MDASYTGAKIAALRKEKGLTQMELAERLHVTNKAVSKWERGKNFPDLPLLQPLAETLDTTVSDLLGIEQPITEDAIAVMTAISQQEKKSVKRSLYQFVLMAMLASALYLIFHFHAVTTPDRILLALNAFILVNGCVMIEYLHKKFAAKQNFRWPDSGDETLFRNLKISFLMWKEHLPK